MPPLPSISAPPASTPRLKRRRVPIEIVDGPAPLTSNTKPSVPAATQEAGRSDLMTPVSSRPLTSTPGTKPAPDTPAQAKTFHAAKEARPAARTSAVRGGIFRPNGKHTLFGENRGEELVASSPPAASLVPANTPPPITQKPPAAQTAQAAASSQVLAEQSITHGTRRRAPLTLFDFSREWERCLTSEDRWALLKVSPLARCYTCGRVMNAFSGCIAGDAAVFVPVFPRGAGSRRNRRYLARCPQGGGSGHRRTRARA